MRDPLLTQVGMVKAQEISKEVQAWLAQRGWALDAVMSSTLVRAVETALLQYPGREVTVAPFIAEMGFGADNLPRTNEEQTAKLREHLADKGGENGSFNVNFHWAEVLAGMSSKQSWAMFLEFLEDFFLPQLLAKRRAEGVSDDRPVVLAVVTHSNFMGEGEISERCKEFYPISPKGKVKPNNNQVLSLGYRLTGRAETAWDVTTRYTLEPEGACEPVHGGVSNWDENGQRHALCISDLGQDAVDYIKKKTGKRPNTLDDRVKGDYDRIVEKIEKVASLRPKKKNKPMKSRLEKGQEIAELTQQMRALKETPCWGDGFPSDPEAAFGHVEQLFPFTRKWSEDGEELQ